MNKAGTLADGLAVPEIGANAFATCQAHNLIDEIITVNEHDIALAILRLVENEQAIVEGGGAVGLAALLNASSPKTDAEKTNIRALRRPVALSVGCPTMRRQSATRNSSRSLFVP